MPSIGETQDGKIVGVFLPSSMIKRLRYHAAQTDQTLRSIITTALDAHLPRNIRVVIDDKETRRAE